MTSAHSMFVCRAEKSRRRESVGLLMIGLAVMLTGCDSKQKLTPPMAMVAPYDQPQLWAVAPFLNESGVSIVKPDRVADTFTEQIEAINGIATVPVNRVLAAMQRLQLAWITTPGEARSVMNLLGLDGLIVGTVTAYDPYSPLKFGAAVQLWRRDSTTAITAVDPVAITRARTDIASPAAVAVNEPAAQASGVFDAANHQVLTWLDEYAAGRNEPDSAYGKRIYLVNMEMYTQFVAYRLLHDLLATERNRLHPQATQPER